MTAGNLHNSVAVPQPIDRFHAEQNTDSGEKSLYQIGGVAALICALMYLVALLVYLPAYSVAPPPATVLEWFTLFQDNPITGLFFLGLADIVISILWGPMSLALYTALKPFNKSWLTIATVLIFVGMAVFLATNAAFSILSLSQQYAAATTEAEQAIVLSAGRAVIAVSEGARYTGSSLTGIGGLIISLVMLRSAIFSKTTARAGILGFALLWLSVPFAGYTTTGPTNTLVTAIVAVSYLGGGLLSLAWYVLVGLRLLQLGRSESKAFLTQHNLR